MIQGFAIQTFTLYGRRKFWYVIPIDQQRSAHVTAGLIHRLGPRSWRSYTNGNYRKHTTMKQAVTRIVANHFRF